MARPSGRPIEGAVATVGVSDRVAFLRKTYGLLGISLIAFAAFTGGMMRYATETSYGWSRWAFSGYNLLLVILLFMGVSWVAQRLAFSDTSRGLQLLGLALTIVLQSLLLQPLLWVLIRMFGNRLALQSGVLLSGHATSILMQAIVITLTIFVGLTLTVFISRKDFSFLRGTLSIATFAVLGVCLASALFGFSTGGLIAGAVVLLMAGYILYETSMIMSQFPPTAYVAAALMLFATVATLFRAVLQVLMIVASDRR